jgi:prepilin peptidase CpaA
MVILRTPTCGASRGKRPVLLGCNPDSTWPEYIKRLRASVLMMTAPAEHLLFAALALGCAAVASFYDVRERRIPNRLTGSCLLAGLLLHLGLGGWHGLGSAAIASIAAGGLFLVFFLAGGMGAGDVKLMAAIGAIAGLAPLQLLILATVLAGGLFALGLAGYHGRLRQTLVNVAALLVHHGREGIRPHPEMNLTNERTLRLPFALPIAAGCLVTFCTLAWGVRP